MDPISGTLLIAYEKEKEKILIRFFFSLPEARILKNHLKYTFTFSRMGHQGF